MHILYEDDLLWVIDKPAGLLVTAKEGQESLEELLRTESGEEEVHLVHRLDRDTSGVIVVAKNQPTREYLQKQFKQRTVQKTYLALLDGDLSTDYVLQETYLARDKFKRTRMRSYPKHDTQQQLRYARSEFFVLQRFHQRLTYVKIEISTGRTHQIRVHAKEMSAPVLGDQVYHRPTVLPLTFPVAIRDKVYALSRQMLHAHQLKFQHPQQNESMCFSSSPPADFADLLSSLQHYGKKSLTI